MKTEKVLFTLEGIAILALLIAALLSDDKLDREAQAWLQIANNVEDVEGNGYYYLLGIAAPESNDPRAFGRRQLALYREAEAAMPGSGAERIDFSLKKPLPLPAGPYYCRVNEDGCYPGPADNPEYLEKELEKHRVLLSRYREFFEFPTLKTLVEPAYYALFLPYEYITRGNKLNQFRIMRDAAHGRRSQALEELHRDIRNIRGQLAAADDLIYKLILAGMLADDLDLLAGLYDPSLDEPMPAIDLLTREERSMRRPMIREFGMNANLFMLLDEHSGFFNEELEISKRVGQFLFKANMSVNNAFRKLKSVEQLSPLSLPEFHQAVMHGAPETDVPFSLRNYIGWVLNSIAPVDSYAKYVSRVNNINCKIALINAALPIGHKQWLSIIKGSSDVPETGNPYNPRELPHADREAGSLCFDGPYEDERGFRCVKRYRVDLKQSAGLGRPEYVFAVAGR